jgi:hypothetical protein
MAPDEELTINPSTPCNEMVGEGIVRVIPEVLATKSPSVRKRWTSRVASEDRVAPWNLEGESGLIFLS